MGVVGIAVAGAGVTGAAVAWEVERAVGGSEDPRSIFKSGASSGRHCQGGAKRSLYRALYFYTGGGETQTEWLTIQCSPSKMNNSSRSRSAAFIPTM